MPKLNASNLSLKALDWAVGTIDQPEWAPEDLLANLDQDEDGFFYAPSIHPGQGFPIIDQNKIDTRFDADTDSWYASMDGEKREDGRAVRLVRSGTTTLIAAMRVFVAAKLGEEIDVPQEVLPISENQSSSVVLSVSIQNGIATMENGTTVDLLRIQAACNFGLQETADPVFSEAVEEMQKLTLKWQGPHGEWFDLGADAAG